MPLYGTRLQFVRKVELLNFFLSFPLRRPTPLTSCDWISLRVIGILMSY